MVPNTVLTHQIAWKLLSTLLFIICENASFSFLAISFIEVTVFLICLNCDVLFVCCFLFLMGMTGQVGVCVCFKLSVCVTNLFAYSCLVLFTLAIWDAIEHGSQARVWAWGPVFMVQMCSLTHIHQKTLDEPLQEFSSVL